MKERNLIKDITLAGALVALAVIGSFISFPVAGSKCAPVQHLVNIIAAVFLGPVYGVGIAFIASLIRNLTGLGSLLAFPGSMLGALCCSLVYKYTKNNIFTCIAEALGTSILGGIAAYFVAKAFMGKAGIAIFVYVIPFAISTVAGSIIAFIILPILKNSIKREA